MPEIFRRLALLSVLFWLSACAGLSPSNEERETPQRDALRDFMLDGRFALRHGDKSTSGRLSWQHVEDGDVGDQVLLASPLGQGMAEIVSNAKGVRLSTSDGRTYAAENAETLTQQVLGYPLPLSKLADWLRGRTHSGTLGESDVFARPLRLREDGWRIAYEYDNDDPQAVPTRLFIEREGEGGFELRLRIDEWTKTPTKIQTQVRTQIPRQVPGTGENEP